MNLLKGKKCLVTGANSGLGLEMTKLFIESGAQVIMLCRNKEKSEKVIQNIRHENPDAKIELEIADLASFQSVYSFIERMKNKHDKLDILVNNAALMKSKITETEDGFETMFQVNFLSQFIITNSLIDLMKSGEKTKIINITLPPEKLQLDFEDIQSLNTFKPMNNLFKTKLWLFLYSIELAERLKESNIEVLTGIPNSKPFKSNLGREMPLWLKLVMKIISINTNKAAQNIIYHAEKDNIETGFVFKGKKSIPLIPYWKSKELRNEIWNQTEKMIPVK